MKCPPNLEIYAKDILPLPQKLCSSETIWLKLFFFSIMWTTVILVKSINNLISWANHYCCNNTFIVTHKPGLVTLTNIIVFHIGTTQFIVFTNLLQGCVECCFLMAPSSHDHACRPQHPIGMLTFANVISYFSSNFMHFVLHVIALIKYIIAQ